MFTYVVMFVIDVPYCAPLLGKRRGIGSYLHCLHLEAEPDSGEHMRLQMDSSSH